MPDKIAPSAPAFKLVVIHDFATYQRGDVITDPKVIGDILAGENETSVNKIAA